ncbi:MAG: hypothetical protein LQ338_000052 [Usnochroma carphineum]|nr:MAG: hypothetical protein LQ338_000052 [Usnochroma carphineum]
MDTVQNHPTTQNFRDTVSNGQSWPNGKSSPFYSHRSGPVVENVKNQSAMTSSEFRNLADSRTAPNKSTATGQPLTRKSSAFSATQAGIQGSGS